MTRQDEFKQKLFALLREYNVIMSAEVLCDDDAVVNFYSGVDWKIDDAGNVVSEDINFNIRWENGKE
jgi:hypothetical protein